MLLKQLLIIDDGADWLNFVSTALKETPFRVVAVGTMQEAISQIKKNRFGIVLIDHDLLSKNARWLQKLVKTCKGQGLRIIVLTPAKLLTTQEVSSLFKLGIDDCVAKPYQPRELSGLLHDLGLNALAYVLIIEDDTDWGQLLCRYLPYDVFGDSIDCIWTDNSADAEYWIKSASPRIVVLDLRLDEDEKGQFESANALLELIDQLKYPPPVIVVSGYATVEFVRENLRRQRIFDYLTKPDFDPNAYRQAICRAILSASVH